MAYDDRHWSEWILIAEHKNYDTDLIDDCGPACYELGLLERGSWFGSVDPMYIGETNNLKSRATSYGRDGSHLNKIIHSHLKRGFNLYIRFQLFHEKEYAKKFQDKMLDKFNYSWNIQRNSDSYYEDDEEE